MSNPLAAESLAGARVLVTGSSRGIGADTVRYFAEAGAKVVVNYRNKEKRALQLVSTIEQAAIQASCETRRLVGQQAQAFTAAALPLCRSV